MATTASFASLRLTKDAYAKYKRRIGGDPPKPPRARAGSARDSHKVRVTGYNGEAKNAIVTSNRSRSEFIEVPWGNDDTVRWIMQRICDKLRIPLENWVLAGQGQVLDSDEPVASYELFRDCPSSGTVDLVLIPIDDVDEYEEENPLPDSEAYVWRHLEPGQTESTDPMERAKATYNLIDPVVSPEWKKYLAQRKADEASLASMLKPDCIEDFELLTTQIKDSVKRVVSEYDLDENEQLAIADCVTPLDIDMEDEGDGIPRSATVSTRIYSPTRPAAIDVWFTYHHRARWESVEYHCSLLFRITNPLTKAALPTSVPQDSNGRVARGWTRMFWMALDNDPPGPRWYRKHLREWGMRAVHAKQIHAALFGQRGRLATAVDKVDAVRLLLASVGIDFRVAREEGEKDRQSRSFAWDGFEHDWMGLNIRDACGVPLDRDATWEAPVDEDPYKDEYEDSEEDSEEEMVVVYRDEPRYFSFR